MDKKYNCTLIRRIVFEDNEILKGLDLWHNCILPFVPFSGLRMEYSHMTFEQGDHGDVFVKEFSSNPIKTISWDCSMERFVCYEMCILVDKNSLKQCVESFTSQHNWFLSTGTDLSEIFEDNGIEFSFSYIKEKTWFSYENWADND